MILPRHRLVPLDAAIAEFDLEPRYAHYRADTLADTFGDAFLIDGVRNALVFDGDTRLERGFEPVQSETRRYMARADAFDELLGQACVVIVDGDLDCPYIDAWRCGALFVFGNVRCDVFRFHQFDLTWISGDLTAARAILASAVDDADAFAADRGRGAVGVQGRVFAPQVRTWFMHLSHLDWAEGSGAEFREEVEYADQEQRWRTDPIWSLR